MKKKKAYVYKFNLVLANILSIVIFALLMIFTVLIGKSFSFGDCEFVVVLIAMFLYFMLHEILHGIGYIIGGAKPKNIKYGICLEKGILYAMSMQEISKKSILISLQMPFMVIGVITYLIGIIFNIELLTFLSMVNIMGASLDIVMFLYILRLPSDTIYSESGNNDEFVLISSSDLRKKKCMFFRVTEVKDYKEEDYIFKDFQKFEISRFSVVIFMILLFDYFLINVI